MNRASFRGFAASALLVVANLTFAQDHERDMRLVRIEPNHSINCTSAPVAIGVDIINWAPGTSYLWSDGQTDSVIYVSPSATQLFHLSVQNSTIGFAEELTFEVEVRNRAVEPLSSEVSFPKNLCLGTEMTVTASHGGGHSPFTYVWSDGQTGKNAVIKPMGEDRHYITITDACGTEAVSEIRVSIEPRDPITAPEQQIEYFSCEGDELSLEGSLNGVAGGVGYGYQYTFSDWNNGNGALKVSAVQDMRVPVKVSDACKTDMASVEIILKKSPIKIPAVGDLIVCANDTTDVVQNVPAQVYYWNGSGYRTSEEEVITKDKNVMLTYIDRCSKEHQIERKIEARDPLADFDYVLENSTGKMEVSDLSDGQDLKYRWSVNGMVVSEETSPELQLQSGTVNEVTLEVEDDKRCKSSVTRRVASISRISAPTAFSPNGDGRNDYYSVSIEEDLVSFKFEVFDRWGQLIYSTNDQYFTWDGRQGSSELPMSTYVYRLQGKTNAGEAIDKFGTITTINEN